MVLIVTVRRLQSMVSKVHPNIPKSAPATLKLTKMIAWTEKGIVGRGILVDFHSWRLEQNDSAYTNFDAFETTPIPLNDLKACLQAQGTEVKFGDILIIRSGKCLSHPLSTPQNRIDRQTQDGWSPRP